MVHATDIPLPNFSRNERKIWDTITDDVIHRTHQKIAGIGHTSENVAHPSFRDLLRRGLPIALRWDRLNIDALIPWKSIGVEMGWWALATFFIEKESPIHRQHLTTKVDHNSYFIRKNDPTHTLLNTRKYWEDGMDVKNCIFLSLNTIVDTKTDGKSTVNAVRRKILHSMNMIMLAGTLTQCSPEKNSSLSESTYVSYESGMRSDTDIYTVEAGDTLSGICRKYWNIFTISDLKAINNINSDIIYVNQVLTLPRAQYFQEVRTEQAPRAIPVSMWMIASMKYERTDTGSTKQWNMVKIWETDAGNFIQMATNYNGYAYKVGGTGSTPEAGIDCSQLIVNALIGTGCIPEWSDTDTKSLQGMSQKLGNKDGQPGDFLIMGGKTPHIAIITENIWNGRYTTFDASPRQKIVCENTRVAGRSYSVYRNPFITGNPEIQSIQAEIPEKEIQATKTTKKLAESTIKEKYHKQVLSAVKTIIANQDKYEEVEKETGVPWQIIAAIHHREGSLDFKTVLHNGERIIGTNKKTKLVPAGHGPFATWSEGAIDALKSHHVPCPVSELILDNAHLLKVAQYLKSFNGEGYNNTQWGNPYLYAGLIAPEWYAYYTTGLYTRDGHYSRKTIDKRPGTIPILLNLLGGGEVASIEEESLVTDSAPETMKQKIWNSNFVTNIRSAPVKIRQNFLKVHGADFDISFRNTYKWTAAQNSALAWLLKKNREFRAQWIAYLSGSGNQSGDIASN